MRSVKTIIKSAVFVALGCVLFLSIQELMVPEHVEFEYKKRHIKGFEALEKNSLDVLFVGASTLRDGAQPMQLYEDYQFLSYNLACSGQPVECSYFLTKYAFQTQSPRVVVLDTSMLFPSVNVNNLSWWCILNILPWGRPKLELIQEYAQKEYTDGAVAALFPIIKYHTRWNALTKDDFAPVKDGPHYAGGGYLFSSLVPSIVPNKTDFNAITYAMMQHNQGEYRYYDGDEAGVVTMNTPLYDPQIIPEGKDFLLKLKQLCEEHGARLVLTKMPSISLPMFEPSVWTEVKSQRMKQLAVELDLPFYDLMYDYETGVDFLTDSEDGGWHLNVRGVLKTSKVLGDILSREYGLGAHPDALYDEMLPLYQKVRDVALLETQTDFVSYVQYLANHLDRLTVYLSVYEEYTISMHPEDYALLEQCLGLRHIAEGVYCDSYMAVNSGGELLYEAIGDRRIEHSMTVDGTEVSLVSAGWYNPSAVSIKIDGVEYATGGRGLNFVIYDNEAGRVIDSVTFDTYQETKPATRNYSKVNGTYLRGYEAQVCYGAGTA